MAQDVSLLKRANPAQLPWCAGPATSIIESMTNRVTRPKPIRVQDRRHTVSNKCGFATLFDPHGGGPASAGLGALNASVVGITLGSVIEPFEIAVKVFVRPDGLKVDQPDCVVQGVSEQIKLALAFEFVNA